MTDDLISRAANPPLGVCWDFETCQWVSQSGRQPGYADRAFDNRAADSTPVDASQTADPVGKEG